MPKDQSIEALEKLITLKIKDYEKSSSIVESKLLKKPDEWGRYQGEVNRQVDDIFFDILDLERITLVNEQKDKFDISLEIYPEYFYKGKLIMAVSLGEDNRMSDAEE